MARRFAGRPHLILPAGLLVVARIVGAVLAYLAVLSAISVPAFLVIMPLTPEPARGAFGLLGLGVAEGVALAIVLVYWRVFNRRPIRELGLAKLDARSRWARGAGVGTLMIGFVVLVGYTLLDGASWQANPDLARASVMVITGLVGYLIQGPAEEVLFRGYILKNVRDEWGVPWAIVVSSATFAVLHASNPGFGPLPLLNLLLFGAGTALYKLSVDNQQLWGVFAIHTVWNWMQQVVFGLPNSGLPTTPDNALFTITPNTALPEFFWGGGFGPEGTVAATVVLVALVGVSLRRRTRQEASL